ncbi:MAG TPA: thioredoxin-dependent thiol peroxidase [Bryobacteraceae bacterium]|jgi:peroxiredoxin Q/BCP|nr:thioredoxin-dependent thiol peroxidase [Bryobacteraceae bacterium]
MLKEGDPAPKIKLQTDTGEPFDLDSVQGKKAVLFFYPKASTPGCTVEACEFRDTFKKFEKKDVVVLGISKDTPKAQTTFKQNQHLPYTLLCDVDKKIAEAYGVWKEKNMYGKKVMGVERTTFIIDEHGKIQKIFSKVKPAGHAEEVLAAL